MVNVTEFHGEWADPLGGYDTNALFCRMPETGKIVFFIHNSIKICQETTVEAQREHTFLRRNQHSGTKLGNKRNNSSIKE